MATTDEDLSVNNSIYLICVGFGLPLPQVTCMHNGRPLTNDTTSTIIHNDVIKRGGHLFVRSTFLLCNVGGEVNGEYTCVARNGVTSSDHTSIVTVPSMYMCIVRSRFIYLISVFLYTANSDAKHLTI